MAFAAPHQLRAGCASSSLHPGLRATRHGARLRVAIPVAQVTKSSNSKAPATVLSLKDVKVRDAMSKGLVSVTADTSVFEVLEVRVLVSVVSVLGGTDGRVLSFLCAADGLSLCRRGFC